MSAPTRRHLNWPILLCAAALLAIGVLFIWSGSLVLTGPEGEGRRLDLAFKQMVWIGIGGSVLLLVLMPHYRFFVENAYLAYAGGIGLLVLLLLLAQFRLVPEISGAHRWIPLGFFLLQPSELMKIALILCLARYLRFRSSYRSWAGLILPFALTLLPMVLIMKQPDLGTALLFLPILLSVLFAAGARLRHLAVILGMAAAAAPLLFFFALHDYQRRRITAFLSQSEIHSPGAMDELYQLIQSKLAIGSGGWLGQGWQQGSMNRLNFLPVRTTDFIFSVIGEEAGFLGLLAVLFLFFVIFASAFAVADRTPDPSGRILVIGSTVLLAAQVFINTAMTIGLMPITGVTLPFVSYGGSSLVTSLVLIGLILNVSRRPSPIVASDDFEFEDDRLERKRRSETRRWATLFRFREKMAAPVIPEGSRRPPGPAAGASK
ncbi:MAG: rod shape-determining protein RodA [Planctomycetes bacterium]|nr:rod shape-determining protein RodA [Planctomycetota bacterium]